MSATHSPAVDGAGPSRPRLWWWFGPFGVLLVVILVTLAFPTVHTAAVTVTQFVWTFEGQASCWNNSRANPSPSAGGMGSPSSVLNASIYILYFPTGTNTTRTTCIFIVVETTTAGWNLVSSNSPLVLPAGVGGQLNATLRAPASDFDGTVGLLVSATSPPP